MLLILLNLETMDYFTPKHSHVQRFLTNWLNRAVVNTDVYQLNLEVNGLPLKLAR